MILVTGGTGFVGQEVVEELLNRGHQVRLLVRHREKAVHYRARRNIELVAGDALKPETLRAAVEGAQAVIHLIGIIAETRHVTFEKAHVDATRNVLNAAREVGIKRWLQMSALGTRHDARSRYHVTKAEAEDLVRQSGLDWTIFRPSLIYGYDDRDRLLNLLRKALSPPLSSLQLHTFPVLDGGQARVQPVSVREVAQCFALAVSESASIDQTYELVGPEPMTWLEMVETVARPLGESPVYEALPVLVVLRGLLNLAAVTFPLAMIASWASGWLDFAEVELSAALEAVLLVAAWRWRTLILFSVPSGPFELAGAALGLLAPGYLNFAEQLKMAEEDNIGDPGPATALFAYEPESFETGVKRIINFKG